MQVKQAEKSQSRQITLQKELEEYDREQLCYKYKEITEELTRFKPQSVAIFEEWVTRVYKLKMKIADLGLQGKNIEFSISAADIQSVVNKVLLESCEIHRHLIEEQLRIIRDMGPAQEFYKIDADEPGVGFLNNNPHEQVTVGEGTKIDDAISNNSQSTFCANQQYYTYCVWAIYNHYCSLSECNKIVCDLAQDVHASSQNLFFRFFKQIQRKKNAEQSDLDLLADDSTKIKYGDYANDLRHIQSMVQDEEVINLNELNVLTIVNLIPPSIPVRKVEGRDRNILYWHICSFEASINTIIYENRQNMRRFVFYLRNFKKAIKILKDRLGKPVKPIFKQQKDSVQRKIHKQKLLDFDFSCQQLISSQIEKKMDKQRLLDEFGIQDEKTRSDEAQLVRNIEQSVQKQKTIISKKPQQGNSFKQRLRQQENELNKPQLKQILKKHSSYSMKQSLFGLKNSNFLQATDSIESITRISAMLTENNIESYKFQVVVKKNQKNSKKDREEQLIEKRRKIDQLSDFKVEKNLQKEIVEQLKNNLNSLIKNQLTKQQQFTNYLKITQKHERTRRHFKFDSRPENCELNLHEFIQQSNFKNDEQESEADENYLSRMEEEHTQNQRKKKKKKNKKKKNQKDEHNPNVQDGSKANEQTTAEQSSGKTKGNLLFDICSQQYEIIKTLQNTKIDKESRMKCFEIQQQLIHVMRRRQMEDFDKSMFRYEGSSIGKTKARAKKQKVK